MTVVCSVCWDQKTFFQENELGLEPFSGAANGGKSVCFPPRPKEEREERKKAAFWKEGMKKEENWGLLNCVI